MVLMLQDKYDNHHHHHHHHHHNLNHTTVKICIKFPISGTQKQFSLSPHMPLDILHKRVPHTQFVPHNGKPVNAIKPRGEESSYSVPVN